MGRITLQVLFRFPDTDNHNRTTAETLRGVEKALMLLGQGAIDFPEGADVVAFVRSGGKQVGKPAEAEPPAP